MRALGIASVAPTIQAARSRGDSAEEFLARLETAVATADVPANARRLRDRAGAIVHFLLNDAWPVDAIVSLDEATRERTAAAARDTVARADDARLRQQLDQERQERQRLEIEWGPRLDALDDASREQVIAFATGQLSDNPRAREVFADRMRKFGREPNDPNRQDLLAAMEKWAGAP